MFAMPMHACLGSFSQIAAGSVFACLFVLTFSSSDIFADNSSIFAACSEMILLCSTILFSDASTLAYTSYSQASTCFTWAAVVTCFTAAL